MNRIDLQLKSQKKYKKDMMDHLGLNDSIYTKWKSENIKSYMKYIVKIAEFLGVSTVYLITGMVGENGVMQLDQEEITLVTKNRLFDSKSQKALFYLIQKMRE